MKINRKEFEKIKNLMPLARNPTKISNQQFLNALLYMKKMAANGGQCQKNSGTGIRFT